MVELRDLTKHYGERCVLRIASLDVPDGQLLAVAGANGSGKTTLLRVLAGLTKPDAGAVNRPADALYLPQTSYAFRGTVLRNLLIGQRGGKNEAKELLEKAGLSSLAGSKAKSLSGGELQRLALCRVLMRRGQLLLLDEPTSACDARGTQVMMSLIKDYRDRTGCSVILSTHAPGVALRHADRLLVLHEGEIAADGAPDDILTQTQSEAAERFLADWRVSC